MSNGDRRAATGVWKSEVAPKVAAPLIVVAVLATLAWFSGVSALPANDLRQEQRLNAVEEKARVTERRVEKNEIETVAELRYINKQLEDIAKTLERQR